MNMSILKKCFLLFLGISASSVFAQGDLNYVEADPAKSQFQHADTPGVLSTKQVCKAKLSSPLKDNVRYVFPVLFPKSGSLSFSLTSGKESFSFSGDGSFNLSDAKGGKFRNAFSVCEQAKRSFAWDTSLFLWSDTLSNPAGRTLSERWTECVLELESDNAKFYLDGVLLHLWKLETSLAGRSVEVSMPAGLQFRQPREAAFEVSRSFVFVPLSSKFNFKPGVGEELKEGLPVPGSMLKLGGVPFLLEAPRYDGCERLDLSQSWFREGTLSSYEEPHNGSFGGRWGGALSGNPVRFQFRVPRADFDTLYVLAASGVAENAIPRFTVQFYRPKAGFPRNFRSPDVPLFTAKGSAQDSIAVKTASGKNLNLHLVKVKIEQDAIKELGDQDILEFELTKDVKVYRAYPDPVYYSEHGGSLPSSVQLFAATLSIAPISVDFQPGQYGNLWSEGETPSFTLKVRNNTVEKRSVKLKLESVSSDSQEKAETATELILGPNESKNAQLTLNLKRFGHHDLALSADAGNGSVEKYKHTLSLIRSREYGMREFDTKGFMFGFWNWEGGHVTPSVPVALELMGKLGMESLSTTLEETPETKKIAQKYGMRSYYCFKERSIFITNDLRKLNYEDGFKKAKDSLEKLRAEESAVGKPVFGKVFSEPGGLGAHSVVGDFYGEESWALKESELEDFKARSTAALAHAKAIKSYFPNAKIVMPHGDHFFSVPFIREKGELASIIDGCAVDIGHFERLPEQQMHQCSIHRLYQTLTFWRKYKGVEPLLISVEGPCIAPVAPGSLTEDEYANYTIRVSLLLAAYGVKRQFSIASGFECADWWGEQHYASGLFTRIPSPEPHRAVSALATHIRNLRNMEFVKWVPTGSLSTYCLQFVDAKKPGSFLHVLWTLRGSRGVSVNPGKDSGKLELFDLMDNSSALKLENGAVSLATSQAPVYVYGLGDNPKISLAEPDNSDSVLAKFNIKLGETAALFTKQSQEAGPEYLDTASYTIRRFPAVMEAKKLEAPAAQGGSALAITLPKQEKDRGVMPFYTGFAPEKPITIKGRAARLAIWVKAASDWGRIVYVLRDAKGEKWISVGTKGEWNCDDTPNASFFNFDGWRLLKFELPNNAPYDSFRESGSTWWGAYNGDKIVDYPLSLERIYVERREKAMYVNSLEAASLTAVEFGTLYAEYDAEADMSKAAETLCNLRMPPPPSGAKLSNPIAEAEASGSLPATKITKVEHPPTWNDGTRGIFHFDEIPDASYEIWLSMNPDGSGALKLGSGLKKSGVQVSGFRANVDFYAFIVYQVNGKGVSKPSAPFKFKLENLFGMK